MREDFQCKDFLGQMKEREKIWCGKEWDLYRPASLYPYLCLLKAQHGDLWHRLVMPHCGAWGFHWRKGTKKRLPASLMKLLDTVVATLALLHLLALLSIGCQSLIKRKQNCFVFMLYIAFSINWQEGIITTSN